MQKGWEAQDVPDALLNLKDTIQGEFNVISLILWFQRP